MPKTNNSNGSEIVHCQTNVGELCTYLFKDTPSFRTTITCCNSEPITRSWQTINIQIDSLMKMNEDIEYALKNRIRECVACKGEQRVSVEESKFINNYLTR